MGYEEDRQRRARELYAKRMREEERRRREEEERRQREQRAEEHRRQMEQQRQQREEAQKKAVQQQAEEQRKAAQQRADDHRRQMAQQKQQQSAVGNNGGSRAGTGQTKPAQAVPNKTAPKSVNTFYTNKPDNGIMEPRFGSVAAYNDEIRKQQEQLKTIHKQQFTSMLKNDGSAVDALEKQYKATEKEISDLKHELGEVMGANVRGKRGNQLLDDERWGSYVPEEGEKHSPNKGNMPPIGNAGKPRLDMSSGKPLFAATDTAARVMGLDDDEIDALPYKEDPFKGQHAYDGKGYSGNGFGGGGAGGSWGEKPSNEVPDYITQSYSGDADSLEYIKSSETFKDVVNMLAMYGQYEESESRLGLQITETEEVDVSKELARAQYNELINQKNTDVKVGLGAYSLMLGSSIGGLFELSGTAAVLLDTGLLLGDIALPGYSVNEDIEDELGGVYKISRFTLDADWDIKGYGGGRHVTRTGYVIYGESIVLDNGVVYPNPLNAVFFDVISE